MSYQRESFADLVTLVNEANATTLTTTDLISGTPSADVGENNTRVRLHAQSGGNYKGRVDVAYDRLDLADLANVPGFRVQAVDATTVHDLLPYIRILNGIPFTADDLEDSALFDDNGVTKATLTAKATSLGWVGSFTVTVGEGAAFASDVITETSLPGLNYPTSSDEDTYAQMYLYGYDFTDHYDILATLPTGALSSEDVGFLVDILQTVDEGTGKLLWNGSGASVEWSLSGGTVLHNGPNDSVGLPSNSAYTYVLAIQLRADVTLPKGTLYLHYNDPFDPTQF